MSVVSKDALVAIGALQIRMIAVRVPLPVIPLEVNLLLLASVGLIPPIVVVASILVSGYFALLICHPLVVVFLSILC